MTSHSETNSKKPAPQPFGEPIVWRHEDRILEVAADRSFGSLIKRILKENPEWVVVVRTPTNTNEIYRYVFTSSELVNIANMNPDYRLLPIDLAVNVHEWTSSRVSLGGRPIGPAQGHSGPTASRIVDYDASGKIVAIGELLDRSDSSESLEKESQSIESMLGTMRGGSGFAATADVPSRAGQADPSITVNSEQPTIDVMLSAETKAEIKIGTIARVPFQIELSGEAIPLEVSQPAQARQDLPIVVSLTVENDTLNIVNNHEFTMNPPSPGDPRTGFFAVKAMREGVCRLAVTFRQGGSDLGIIALAMAIITTEATEATAKGEAVALPRDLTDDDKLALLVEQRVEQRVDGNKVYDQVYYQYTLHSEALGLPYQRVPSQPLLDNGGGPAATMLAYLERIYAKVTRELQDIDDLKELQRSTRALGASLSRELLGTEVEKLLWALRDRIKLVQIVSWEPYIPWELVRLCDPDSDEIDERFLCEYGMIRTLPDETPLRTLTLDRWAYLRAEFPSGALDPVGAELDYFTNRTSESLHSYDIKPTVISPTRDGFYNALSDGDFDVLHISCHADSPHQSIDRASLIIGEETVPGQNNSRLVQVDTITVAAEARLTKRRPLIFLNACETGRVGAVLTDWGGWPNVFLRKGAGAFVGTSWSVRDKPAAVFSTTFYNALLNNKTLVEAASAAREAAKKLGDASWLAFKVYGHPRAQRGK